jgi:cytochrome c553
MGQEFARKPGKLQIHCRHRPQYDSSLVFAAGIPQSERMQHSINSRACTVTVTSVRLPALAMPTGAQKRIMRTLILSGFLLLISLGGGSAAQAAGDIEKGKVLYKICTACHGPDAEGMATLNAPANAGQDPWYMTRQLKNFSAGIRGAHPDDTFGAQMRPMAMMLADEEDITNVVAYLSSMDMPDPPITVDGDVEAGKKAYETCIPCHGEFGQGAQSLDAPRLSNQHDWYIVRQLENFKAGVRGTHQSDIYGAQMRIMAQMLETDEQVRAVAAYIATIEYRPGME